MPIVLQRQQAGVWHEYNMPADSTVAQLAAYMRLMDVLEAHPGLSCGYGVVTPAFEECMAALLGTGVYAMWGKDKGGTPYISGCNRLGICNGFRLVDHTVWK